MKTAYTIDSKTTKAELKALLLKIGRSKKTTKKKGIKAYFGSVKLDGDPLALQKEWRDEWN